VLEFDFAELDRVLEVADGESVAAAGRSVWTAELRPVSSTLDTTDRLGDAASGGAWIDCDPGSGGIATCAPVSPELVEVAFIEVQPETENITRNPAIIGLRIDCSIQLATGLHM
jgi:hypothetical protein